ncbi:unnamed protein product [Discosporangium mesarthrocarpum]
MERFTSPSLERQQLCHSLLVLWLVSGCLAKDCLDLTVSSASGQGNINTTVYIWSTESQVPSTPGRPMMV